MFTKQQITYMSDALNMAIASNKRMQNSKPQFSEIFNQIHRDLVELQTALTLIRPIDKQK